jgi:molecular chaperone GrpE
MIDFGKELEKFDFFSVDSKLQGTHKELTNVLSEVNSTLGRIGKEQGKANIQLEELMIILDEEKEKHEVIENLKKRIDSSEDEKLSIIKGLIKVLDQIENFYRLFANEENESLYRQLSLMWELIYKILLSIGITRIDDENTIFEPSLNNIVGTNSNTDLDEGTILSVLKSGYIYKDVVLRKSEVIANKHIPISMEEDNTTENKENEYEEISEDNGENLETEDMYDESHKDEGIELIENYPECVEREEGEGKESIGGKEAIETAEDVNDAQIADDVYNADHMESTEDVVINEAAEGYTNIHTKRQMNIPMKMRSMNVQIEENTDIKMKEPMSIQIKENVDVQVEGNIVAQLKKHRNICMEATNKESIYIGSDEIDIKTDEIEANTAKENNLSEGEIDEQR